MKSFTIIIGMMCFMLGVWHGHIIYYQEYDYHVSLYHNSITIDTDDGRHIVIPADSSLQGFIDADNLDF